jgi:hypothetical protein
MLCRTDSVAEFGEPVVAAPLIIESRIGPLVGLLDQALVEHPLDRAVERARSHSNRPTTQFGDIAHDRVAMLLAVGERHDDVHHRHRQRQEPFDLVSVTHVTTMTTLDLLCQ